MYICKLKQDVKYVQFNGAPIELINGNKYTNEKLISAYPEYFVKLEDIIAEKASVKVEPIVEVAQVAVEEIKIEEEPKLETLNEVITEETPKKKAGRPSKVLIDDSSDVSIEVTE